jgi:serine protease AprX
VSQREKPGAGVARLRRRVAAGAVASSAIAAVVVGTGAGIARADVSTPFGYDPLTDRGSLYNVENVIGAEDLYAAGFTGKGVGVALIDTGVAAVPGLTSGNVVDGPDLSFDSQDPSAAHVDGFGHGTHMASIIAGRDVAGTPASYTDPGNWHGIAPDATLVDVKVGAADGAIDVSQVIAGIDWVVQHKDDNHVRVINLSYGTDSVQSSMVDPLAFAVENAWQHGIVVVVSGGNDGDTSKTLADPASDPHVIAVGAMDDGGTADTRDDAVPSWSTHGTDARHVDVVAPGVSVLGLRAPGSAVDQANPGAAVGARFERGSGTSQAAAVVSGEIALLLQANPGLTPDQVKVLLQDDASRLPRTSVTMGGSGGTDLKKVFHQLLKMAPIRPAPANSWGTGTGSLEAARGDSHVGTDGVELTGEFDVFGQAWDGAAWAKADADKHAWKDGRWRGETWTGKGWKDLGNGRRVWQTTVWTQAGATPTDDAWSSKTWRDDAWSSKTWRDDAWSSKTWRDDAWSSKTWRDDAWSSKTWRDDAWSSKTWRDDAWSSKTWRDDGWH